MDLKQKARSIVQLARRKGTIKPPRRCTNCGGVKKLDGHHFDYSKPLALTWLCRPCHKKAHHLQQSLKLKVKSKMKTVQISDELHAKLKSHCDAECKIMTKYINKAIQNFLDSRNK